MKFAHSLKFNAVPEWQDYYVNYPALKKTIYKLQQEQLKHGDGNNAIDPTTVTELLELESKKLHEENKISENNIKDSAINNSSDEEGNDDKQKFSSKLLNRFKKNKKITFDADLESGDKHSVSSFTLESENYAFHHFINASDEEGFDSLKIFTKQLLQQLQKIDEFFLQRQHKIFKDFDNLVKDLERNEIFIEEIFKRTQAYNQNPLKYRRRSMVTEVNRDNLTGSSSATLNSADLEKQDTHVTSIAEDSDEDSEEDDDEDDDDDDEDDHQHSANSALLDHSHFHVDQQKRIALKKKSTNIFIELSELKSFIELNKIGFTKITKKFDKSCNFAIKQDFVSNFLPSNSQVFVPKTLATIDFKINEVIKMYAFMVDKLSPATTAADLEDIKLELKSHLRDHIVWERNTVWKDLLSIEKKSYDLELHKHAGAHNNKMGDESNVVNDMILQLNVKSYKLPRTVFGYNSILLPASLLTWQVLKIVLIVIVFVILMTVKTMNDPEEHRCLAVLVTCALLWATEAIPLYITGMLVPFLTVTCKVLKSTDGTGHMTGADAADYIFGTMWNSTIMLLMGGFTLAAALSKYNIAKIISSWMLAAAGTKPRNILLAIMAISLFLAMWISNVAAPVLCFSLIQPVLRTLPTTSPLSQALMMGIALASNMAGMASPISSPQNIIALEYMSPNPGWGKWFGVALPVSVIGTLGIWVLLIFTFDIANIKVQAFKPIKDKFTVKQWYIMIVTVATILCWCFVGNHNMAGFLGASGVISILPIVLFFGPGLLTVQDLNNFPWSIVVLAMGGIALGKAVSSSGLLKTVAEALQDKIMDFNIYAIVMIFGILILVVATFVSHTVAALIIVPLVKEVGESLPTPHPLLLIMSTTLIASAAMALPTSGFPNVTAISMTDELGQRYLTVNTFITRGVPASIIGYICVVTIGYGIMTAVQF